MASTLPPVKNAAFTFDIALVSTADTDIFKTSPTLADGDITVSLDGGNFANITTLPTQIQTTGMLPVALSADEMNADKITVLFHDAAGAEWQDAVVTIHTCGQTLDTIGGQTDDIGVAGAGLTAVPGLVWAHATRTLTSLSALLSSIAAAIWTYATRTLTSSAAATAAAVAGSTITITRGDTASVALTGLGNISTRDKLWITVKERDDDTDAESIIQIEETGGLLYLNGAAAATAADGDIAVDDEAAGNITITIKPAATTTLTVGTYDYDVQQLTTAGAVQTMTSGVFAVSKDTTRAIA